MADPNRTSSTIFTSVASIFAILTVRASHRLAPTSLRDQNLCIIRAGPGQVRMPTFRPNRRATSTTPVVRSMTMTPTTAAASYRPSTR